MTHNPLPQNADMKMCWLNPESVDDIMRLQATVCDQLTLTGQGHFFVPLSKEKRLDLFSGDHAVAGLYVNSELAAHMVFFRLCKKNLLRERYHSLTLNQPQVYENDYYVISEMVDPSYRRQGLMSKLADWAMADLYFEAPTVNPTLWATVSSINMVGLQCNLKLGLRIQEEGLNLIDGTPVYLLSGRLLPTAIVSEVLQQQAA